jgi:excisionase family DNA binding protein
MAMTEAVSMAEFARRVGVSRPRISQLVAEGKLPATPGPKRLIPYAEGLRAWQVHRATATGQPLPGGEERPLSPTAVAGSPPPAESCPEVDTAVSYAVARARKESAKARLAELDLAEREGSLIPIDEVKADAVTVLGSLRAVLLALPGRVALRCEGKSAAEIEEVLSDHVNGMLAEWHQGRFDR